MKDENEFVNKHLNACFLFVYVNVKLMDSVEVENCEQYINYVFTQEHVTPWLYQYWILFVASIVQTIQFIDTEKNQWY